MKTPKIVTLLGGISQGSLNKKLFHAVRSEIGAEAEFILADISHLPYFSQDLENDPPDSVEAFKDLIRHADAVLFITPEYNRSIPGVLKNAIDWCTRPYPHNLWQKIPVAMMGASSGNTGTFGAQNHLRAILNYLNAYILNRPEFYLNGSKVFDEEGNLIDENTRNHIRKFWEAFKEWIARNSELDVDNFITGKSSPGEDYSVITH